MPVLRLQFLGCGDAFGSGGRLHTCFLLSSPARESGVLIDCGASSMAAMRRQGVDPNTIEAILVSHLHGDHFGGIPFFLLDARHASKRSSPLTIAGPPGIEDRVSAALAIFFPGAEKTEWTFPVRFVELAEGERAEVVEGVRATPREVVHPSGAPSYALRVECAGKVVGYSGDTEWTDALLEVASGADLFVCECFAWEEGVPYHLDYATLSRRRGDLAAKRVVLTHLGREMLERLDEVDLEVAADGTVVEV